MASKWKAATVLTCLLAAGSVRGLPQPAGTFAEEILDQTATEETGSFKTQYPPSNANERLLIPEAKPVSAYLKLFGIKTRNFNEYQGLPSGVGQRRSPSTAPIPDFRH